MHFHSLALVLLSFLFSTPLNLLERERMGRFKCLVESEEGMASFRAQYRIPPNVDLRYCEEGEWFERRQVGEVVIPMIAFIEGGMRIPMGRVMRDYLGSIV